MTQPVARSVNHIGLTVGNLEEGITFYREALGFRLLAGPFPLVPDDSHFGTIAKAVYGADARRGRFAHLVSGNGVGLELFQFEDPEANKPAPPAYFKNGYHHMALTAPDIDAFVGKIEAHGGKRHMPTFEVFEGTGKKVTYCQDPFGNWIELFSHAYEDMWNMG
jgi:catechol 2,3-dioxygenase-like lactoylglutathione lyase family enzyme